MRGFVGVVVGLSLFLSGVWCMMFGIASASVAFNGDSHQVLACVGAVCLFTSGWKTSSDGFDRLFDLFCGVFMSERDATDGDVR